MSLLLIALLPFAGAALPLLFPQPRHRCVAAALLAPAIALLLVLSRAGAVLDGAALRAAWEWLPQLGLRFGLRLDGLALLFALLILGIGILVIVYARYYLSQRDSLPRLYALLLLFMGAMLGLVMADNLLLMLVFWELTSVVSFLLIGYWSGDAGARRGARMALAVTGGGGLALLAGMLLLGRIAGGFDLDTVLAAGPAIHRDPLYPVALVLILLGAFTKSAQFPFQFWLPRAMAAPTPVSAYLHSATMVKAGVFLLARLYPALAGPDLWFYLVSLTGLAALLLGAYLALLQHDLKGLLAYSTISHLGLITLLFGLDTPLAAVAGVFHIINHAIFKASLFMAAGIIDHETGSRDMRHLQGLWRYLPHTALLAMVASASMAGVPLLNGFLSKEMFFAETLGLDRTGLFTRLVPLAATLAGVFAVAYSLRFIHDVFFNGETPSDLPLYPPHEPPRYMKVPVEVLVVLCLLVGMAPAYTVAPLLNSAAGAVLGGPVPVYSLSVWHGFTPELLMSVIALVGGVLLYALRRPLFERHDRLPTVDGRQLFEAGVDLLVAAARRLTALLDNRSLPRYLALLVGAAVVTVASALWALPRLAGPFAVAAPDAVTVLGAALGAAAALATVAWHRRRLRSLFALGAVGLVVVLVFARFSAPDLALTQFAVEGVSLLLILLALRFLPQRTPRRPGRLRHWRDAALAAAAGLGAAAIAFAVMTRPYDPISQFFVDHALPGGGGHNIVNVILVDFRGFDTLGEITVLLIAAVGCAALLDGLRLPAAAPAPGAGHSPILAVLAQVLLPLALLLAVHIFLRGHNAPGGGFVAGLITAAALALQYIAQGRRWMEARLRLSYRRLAAAGVLLATATGLGSWVWQRPFLTSAFGHLEIPLLGHVELASAMLFDLGVYAAVVGVTLLILTRLGGIETAPETPPWK